MSLFTLFPQSAIQKFVLTVLVTYPWPLQAQKINTDKIDDFTGERMLLTKEELIARDPSALKVAIGVVINKSKDTSYALHMSFGTNSRTTSLDDKNHVQLKLSDGSIISQPYSGPYKVYSASEYPTVFYLIDKDDFESLRTKTVQKIRIETSDISFDFPINGKFQNKIPSMIEAINERLQSPSANK